MLVSSELFLVSILYTLAQCEIPSLNVRKLDRELIARKRHDTLEMCKVFTEENAKIEGSNVKIIPSYKRNLKIQTRRRVKRQTAMKFAVNPALNEDDERRVENIVDKLYDDMEEKGQKVTYRHNSISSTTTQAPTTLKKMHRRLFFAPAMLEGPASSIAPSPTTESARIVQRARWKHGIVPYFIDSKTYDAHLQFVIMKAFDYVEKATCIRLQKLRERPTDQKSLQDVGWIYITNPSGIRQCVHSNEKRKIDGVQMIVFGYDCMSRGDIVHEVMHILGFSHEHTRADRDQYVSILWDNIKPGYKKYFELNKDDSEYNLASLPYDYASVLHYPPRAFSRNGQVTILAEGMKLGQREGLSEIDVQKVGLVYSSECVDRNRDYLLKTCPSVVKSKEKPVNISQEDIDNYFRGRLWSYGIVSYKFRDKAEFSTEEILNLKSVFRHIEKETCIQFRDIAEDSDPEEEDSGVQKETSSKPQEEIEKKDITEEDTKDIKEKEESKESQEELPEIVITEPLPDANKDPVKKLDEYIAENQNANEIGTGSAENPPESKLRSMVKVPANVGSVKKANQTISARRRVKRQVPPKAGRRHANDIMILVRTPIPGCKCPSPGRKDGNHVLEINADCFNSVNDLLHVFVHVLGLDHQHNTHDRDDYLHIVWKNLNPDIKKEMEKKLPPAASVGFPYDYQSVMHYPWLQIKEGVTNIMYPIWNDGWAMGHWQGLSSIDVQKLNLLYFSQCVERQKSENE